ncbi:MAG: CNNM domain-containing protein, partial [candidate division NC10 bacterium]
MDQPAVQYGLLLVFLLALSGGLSAAETALFSLTAEQVGTVAARSPRAGVRLQDLLSRPRRTLLTLRVCDTLINLASAAVALALAAVLAPERAWLGPLLLVPVLLLLGELSPRFVAAARPLPLARALTFPLSLLVSALTPLRRLLRGAADSLLRRLGVAGGGGVTEEEVHGLLEAGTAAGLMAPGERDMIRRALAFGDIRVRDVMTPRADMFCLEASLSLPEA